MDLLFGRTQMISTSWIVPSRQRSRQLRGSLDGWLDTIIGSSLYPNFVLLFFGHNLDRGLYVVNMIVRTLPKLPIASDLYANFVNIHINSYHGPKLYPQLSLVSEPHINLACTRIISDTFSRTISLKIHFVSLLVRELRIDHFGHLHPRPLISSFSGIPPP
jgi:hypothetical protein